MRERPGDELGAVAEAQAAASRRTTSNITASNIAGVSRPVEVL